MPELGVVRVGGVDTGQAGHGGQRGRVHRTRLGVPDGGVGDRPAQVGQVELAPQQRLLDAGVRDLQVSLGGHAVPFGDLALQQPGRVGQGGLQRLAGTRRPALRTRYSQPQRAPGCRHGQVPGQLAAFALGAEDGLVAGRGGPPVAGSGGGAGRCGGRPHLGVPRGLLLVERDDAVSRGDGVLVVELVPGGRGRCPGIGRAHLTVRVGGHGHGGGTPVDRDQGEAEQHGR